MLGLVSLKHQVHPLLCHLGIQAVTGWLTAKPEFPGSLMICFKVPLSLGRRAINFFKTFSPSKDSKHGLCYFLLSIRFCSSPKSFPRTMSCRLILGLHSVRAAIREPSTKGAQLIAGKQSAESKIHNFDVHMSIKEHILWLQVPVYDVSLCGNTIQLILAVGKCLWLSYSFEPFSCRTCNKVFLLITSDNFVTVGWLNAFMSRF